jgi:hypothetical protein
MKIPAALLILAALVSAVIWINFLSRRELARRRLLPAKDKKLMANEEVAVRQHYSF